ncbi:hypothetical protein EG329_003728 [Mollisiaceae sp. DMI_Dod_QoI]|nr:hypothetical protein EG329_003728 [Helotiales sp. DMI_Dod_QoI]
MAIVVDNTYVGSNRKYDPAQTIVADETSSAFDIDRGQLVPSDLITSWNVVLLEAAKLGPTILPILFTIILPDTLRLLARWRAQTGDRLQGIEVLIGSRSFPDTVVTIFKLGDFRVLCITLMSLWVLSPLGGQASLRVLYRESITNHSINIPWKVIDTFNHGPWDELSNGSSPVTSMTSLHLESFYLNALSQSPYVTEHNNSLPFDSSGLPILPITGSIGWNCSIWGCPEANYSSFIGIPIYGPFDIAAIWSPIVSYQNRKPFRAQADLTFPVSLFDFNCSSPSKHNITDPWTEMLPKNGSVYDLPKGRSGFFFDVDLSNFSGFGDPQGIVFGSFQDAFVNLWQYSVTHNARDVLVNCIDPMFLGFPPQPYNCLFVSVAPPRRSNSTIWKKFPTAISYVWPLIDPNTPGISTRTETFLATGSTSFNVGHNTVDLSEVDSVTFSNRLTTAFNTFWLASLSSDVKSGISFPITDATTTTPTFHIPFEVVRVNWAFLSILLMTSVALLFCSIFGIWLRYQINTPDTMGYISSMEADNES